MARDQHSRGAWPIVLGLMASLAVTSVRADVAPPVEIKVSPDTRAAISGQPYAGVFEVRVFRPGMLSAFDISGDGWTILSAEKPDEPLAAGVGVINIPFVAQPSNANKPLVLTLKWNGRRVRQAFDFAPKDLARHGATRMLQRIDPAELDSTPSTAKRNAGGAIPLHCTGRVKYLRAGRDLSDPPDGDVDDAEDIPPRYVGVDSIRVRVIDNDTVGSEVIWSGLTDVNGYFDTGVVMWDDCDALGCDDPDLILEVEANTDVVDVTDNSITEDTYTWQTEELTDFTGSFHDFGEVTPLNSAERPALHIFNGVVRTHRFIQTRTGYDTPHVQVEWPDLSLGNAGAHYEDGPVEIHIGALKQWHEDTISHEYGHHFMHMFSITVDPDYCNGWCDGENACTFDNDCPDEGHCVWCPETDHDAWNEGWPNWLADVVTRSYTDDYTFDDGSPASPLYFRSQEGIGTCCVDDDPSNSPLETEGYVGALLRDIEDSNQDSHGGVWTDSLCLGVDEIFEIVAVLHPVTMQQFLVYFQAVYPEHSALLYPTAANVDPAFVSGFPADDDPPGVVQVLDSPTHPLGIGGPLPCIVVEWEHAPDVGRGACAYSFEWTTDPNGVLPDTAEDAFFFNGCLLSTASGFDLGDYYFSIRTRDCGGNWGSQAATFGPFTVTDCNGTGILDLCDIDCAHEGYGGCSLSSGFCDVTDCGLSEDCNVNLAPDECDIADGTSDDCNQSGVPDECEVIFHWKDGGTDWNETESWEESQLPTNGSDVCINVAGDATAMVTHSVADIGVLASEENMTIQGSTVPHPDITLNEPSWINGDLTMSGATSWLRVLDRLDINGTFDWTGTNNSSVSHLTGPGETHLNGQMQVASNVHIVDHTLVLDGGTTAVSTGRMHFDGSSTLRIMPGATFDYQGTSSLFEGWTDDLIVNQGTIIKSASSSDSAVSVYVENEGTVHVMDGTLTFWSGINHSRTILGDPGATVGFYCGHHDTQVGSSITAETVRFTGGSCGQSFFRGTYNVSALTSFMSGSPLTFTSEADVVSYGQNLTVQGFVTFDAVLGKTVSFDNLTIAGTARFNSGDPLVVATLDFNGGTFYGPSDLTVTGQLNWGAGAGFTGPNTIHVNGDMSVGPGGGVKSLTNYTMNLAGNTTMLGGFQMNGATVLNNMPGAVIDIQVDSGGSIIGGSSTTQFNNAGTLEKSAGVAVSTVATPTTNTGVVEVQSGILRFSQPYTQTAGQTILNGGEFAMWWSNTNIPPVQLDGGELIGSGPITANQMVTVNNAAATVKPGFSAGTITIAGHYNQSTKGTLEIEIGGTGVGTFDTLEMTGTASLAGELCVTEIGNFVPEPGDSFVILTASSVNGEFDTTIFHHPYEIKYNAQDVTLIIPVLGDVDGNGNVDLKDYAALQLCFAGADTPPADSCPQDADADLDNDGDVDFDDQTVLVATLGGGP